MHVIGTRVQHIGYSAIILIALSTAAVLGGCLAAVIFLGVVGMCLNKRFRQQRAVAPDPEAGAEGDSSLTVVCTINPQVLSWSRASC